MHFNQCMCSLTLTATWRIPCPFPGYRVTREVLHIFVPAVRRDKRGRARGFADTIAKFLQPLDALKPIPESEVGFT
jgi:hypothetical protein